MKFLSIIIPSYNTEQFIKKNMATFLDERLYDKVEILLINDGSKDNTAVLASEYEKNYPGYVRFINKENGGHGSVINRGINEAAGKYMKVIDADDWVDTDNLVRLQEVLVQTDADVVINPYIKIHQQTNETLLCGTVSDLDNSSEIAFVELMNRKYKLTLHSATYKTSIFRDNDISVTEKCFYEDFQYTLYPIPYLTNALYCDFPVYYYLVGQKSQSVNATSGLRNINMYQIVYRDSLDYFDKIKPVLNNTTCLYMRDCICDFLRSMYNVYLRNYKVKGISKQLLETDAHIKNMSLELYVQTGEKNRYIRLLRKGNVFLFRILGIVFKIYKSKDIS